MNHEGLTMHYPVKIGDDNLILTPDIRCLKLGTQVGDILIGEAVINSSEIVMAKYSDQTLNDTEIASAGSVTRVILLPESL